MSTSHGAAGAPTRVVWCLLVLTVTASFKVGDDEAIVVCVWSAGSLPKAVDNKDRF